MSASISVLKIGGSVLTGPESYRDAARLVADRVSIRPDEKIVVVVSAELGATDALLATAQEIVDRPASDALDLLWSTGEIRSVALLTLHLHALGVNAAPAGVHQTGLRQVANAAPGAAVLRPLRLRALLEDHDVVVTPGFLARGAGDGVVSLGRGGSDLTAVLLAAGLAAARCEMVKDVAGYFTADPRLDPGAHLLPWLSFETALRMADGGCTLVQRAALEAALADGVQLVITGPRGRAGTRISTAEDNEEGSTMEFSTRTIHAGQPSEPETGSLIAPIFQTSTYEQQSPGVHHGFDYSRTNNPTRARLEAVLADLEGVTHAAVFASGLAAENAILQAYLRPGDEIIIPLDVYGGTYRMLTRVYEPAGCTVRQIDLSDHAAVTAAFTPRTRIVWIESPTNPRLLVYDIAAICATAHANGALVVVDNTFATPVFQQPFQLGADLVVHSVTKYLAGHSDLIQGAVLARDPGVFEPVKFLQNATGAVPSAFDCWLTLRGLKTLELRMERHALNAEAIAIALQSHPLVRRVYYPGLPTHPGHELAARQMTGFGGMVSFELDGTVDDVVGFVSSRRFFVLGESLGGVKSLLCHPARMTHASIPAPERAKLGLSDTLIRLSPGCEHRKDLVADLVEGLDRLASGTPRAKAEAGAYV